MTGNALKTSDMGDVGDVRAGYPLVTDSALETNDMGDVGGVHAGHGQVS